MDKPGDVGSELVAPGAANAEESNENAPVEHLHSRRTLITGAAMGVGLAAAAGAMADASPARASTISQRRNGANRAARPIGRKSLDVSNSEPAFMVDGTSSFSDVVSFARSGVVSIPAGKVSATQTGVSLSSSSLVLANSQNHISGLRIEAVVPDVADSSFTIFLSGRVPPGKTLMVGWFIVN